MALQDLILDLPESVSLSKLVINPEFSGYNELIQRVVVLVLLHSMVELGGHADLEFSALAGKATTGALSEIERRLSSMESVITNKINEDVPKDDLSNRIRVLSLALNRDGTSFKLIVNIETESKDILTGEAVVYG